MSQRPRNSAQGDRTAGPSSGDLRGIGRLGRSRGPGSRSRTLASSSAPSIGTRVWSERCGRVWSRMSRRDFRYEIVIVDNSASANAHHLVQTSWGDRTALVRYLNEPRTNIAHARNAGIAAARGAYIAFMDDDMAAPPDWLANAVETMERTGADVLLGKVVPEFEGDGGWGGALPDPAGGLDGCSRSPMARSYPPSATVTSPERGQETVCCGTALCMSPHPSTLSLAGSEAKTRTSCSAWASVVR